MLDGVDFTVEPGRTVAVVGPTGSGKSHADHAADPAGRPGAGRDQASTASTCATSPGRAGRSGRAGAADRVPVRRHDPRQRHARRRLQRRGRLGRAADRPGRRLRRGAAATAWTPRSASAVRRCPAASGSASPWPARWSGGRGCSILDDATSAVDPQVEARILAGLRRDGGRAATTVLRDRLPQGDDRARRRGPVPRRAAGSPTAARTSELHEPHGRLPRPGRRLREGRGAAPGRGRPGRRARH